MKTFTNRIPAHALRAITEAAAKMETLASGIVSVDSGLNSCQRIRDGAPSVGFRPLAFEMFVSEKEMLDLAQKMRGRVVKFLILGK